jgi:peroxiredoxin (alkyl hydroperoxide reductase subunit C)
MRYGLIVKMAIVCCLLAGPAWGVSEAFKDQIYNPGQLKPVDSVLKVRVGDQAPDFSLPAVAGGKVSLSDFRGRKNVVLSFVPAAWTPVCSDQWPGYNIARPLFEKHNAVLLGITVDNIPTLFAWTRQMGDLWFEVLSDFWPHGAVADRYGVLRGDGTTERALIFIDTQGVIRHVHVEDINRRPPLEQVAAALEKFSTP